MYFEIELKSSYRWADSFFIAIIADEEPTIPEVEKFLSVDMAKLGYDIVEDISELTEKELYIFYDTTNIDSWHVLHNGNQLNQK